MVEDFNRRMLLKRKLRVTNEEAALTEDQIAQHFASIDEFSAQIEQNPSNAAAYFGRGMDFMLVQDFTEAMKDFSRVIEMDPSFTMAYFNRAVVRNKQLDYNQSQQTSHDTYDLSAIGAMNLSIGKKQPQASGPADPATSMLKDNKRAYEHEQIMRDYDLAIKQNPGFVYAYFNRANLRCAQRDFRAAVTDYSEAIEREPEFAEAYYNRGLARLSLGDVNRGIADLSKAGELGIYNAYSIIKRMTSR